MAWKVLVHNFIKISQATLIWWMQNRKLHELQGFEEEARWVAKLLDSKREIENGQKSEIYYIKTGLGLFSVHTVAQITDGNWIIINLWDILSASYTHANPIIWDKFSFLHSPITNRCVISQYIGRYHQYSLAFNKSLTSNSMTTIPSELLFRTNFSILKVIHMGFRWNFIY